MRPTPAVLLSLVLLCPLAGCRSLRNDAGTRSSKQAIRQTDVEDYRGWAVLMYARARVFEAGGGGPAAREAYEYALRFLDGRKGVPPLGTERTAAIVKAGRLRPGRLVAAIHTRIAGLPGYDAFSDQGFDPESPPETFSRSYDLRPLHTGAPEVWAMSLRMFQGGSDVYPEMAAAARSDWRNLVLLMFGLSFMPWQHDTALEGKDSLRIVGSAHLHASYRAWFAALMDGHRLLRPSTRR